MLIIHSIITEYLYARLYWLVSRKRKPVAQPTILGSKFQCDVKSAMKSAIKFSVRISNKAVLLRFLLSLIYSHKRRLD